MVNLESALSRTINLGEEVEDQLVSSITVRAPSSTANLGPGFDVFGLALDAFYDTVKITKTKDSHTLGSIRKN